MLIPTLYIVVVSMITDIQKMWLEKELDGKLKRKDDPRKYSAYRRRIRAHIEKMRENLIWLAENRPDILEDIEFELSDDTIERHRNAKTLLKAVTLFESEPTVWELLQTIYSSYQIELQKKE